MMEYMRDRNAMQLSGGGDSPSPKPAMMSPEEAEARKAEYKRKFGVDRGGIVPKETDSTKRTVEDEIKFKRDQYKKTTGNTYDPVKGVAAYKKKGK